MHIVWLADDASCSQIQIHARVSKSFYPWNLVIHNCLCLLCFDWQVLIKYADRNGLQSLDEMEGEACNGQHLDAQQAATLQRLITAARNALRTLHRVEDDSGKWNACPLRLSHGNQMRVGHAADQLEKGCKLCTVWRMTLTSGAHV